MPMARDIVIPQARRRTLASLIDLYESNYYRLLRLVPELGSLEGTVVSRVAGALDLYLTVHERQRYTTTFSLTYRFGGRRVPAERLHRRIPRRSRSGAGQLQWAAAPPIRPGMAPAADPRS